jgi:predicted phosphodiesterase
MITNVAVLSDIHGVPPVLEAVLDEPEVAEADLIVVTGDHAAGTQPVAVLDRLLDLDDRVLLVRANADRELVALAQGKESTVGEPYEIDLWAAQQLSAEHVALLADLPHPVTDDYLRATSSDASALDQLRTPRRPAAFLTPHADRISGADTTALGASGSTSITIESC